MNTLRNSVQLVGHLGKDPEISNLAQGKKLARVSLAYNEFYTSGNGEKVSNTHWFNLVAWESTAAYMEKHLAKGNQVMVKGRLSSRTYEDKNGGTRSITEIIVSEVLKITREEPASII
jgi:single-strand DNA-binding protein